MLALLEFERLKISMKEVQMDQEPTCPLHKVLQGMKWIMFHGLQDSPISTPQRGASNHKSRRPWSFTMQNQATLDLELLIMRKSLHRLDGNSIPGRVCLFSSLNANYHTELFQYPMVRPSDELQGPSQSHVHGFWSSIKWASFPSLHNYHHFVELSISFEYTNSHQS